MALRYSVLVPDTHGGAVSAFNYPPAGLTNMKSAKARCYICDVLCSTRSPRNEKVPVCAPCAKTHGFAGPEKIVLANGSEIRVLPETGTPVKDGEIVIDEWAGGDTSPWTGGFS